MPGRYLRLVVLQEILRGAGCCVFSVQLSVLLLRRWTVLNEKCMFFWFLFLIVFSGVCFQSEGVGMNCTVSCYEEIPIDLIDLMHSTGIAGVNVDSCFIDSKENTSKAPQAPIHLSLVSSKHLRRSIFQRKPEPSTGFGSLRHCMALLHLCCFCFDQGFSSDLQK